MTQTILFSKEGLASMNMINSECLPLMSQESSIFSLPKLNNIAKFDCKKVSTLFPKFYELLAYNNKKKSPKTQSKNDKSTILSSASQ